MSIKQKDVWQNVGNAPCTFKLTNRWRWKSGFTNKTLQSNEKIIQSLSGFDNVSLVSHSDIKKNMVWQPSHYALRSQNFTLCFIFWLTVPYTTGTVAASSSVQWPGTSHSMFLSATTTEARAPWDTIPMTRRPFRSRPENSSPATLSCYNRKQSVWTLTANLMP